MAITYVWTVERIDCIPHVEGRDNVVLTVFWRVSATDGTHTTSTFGSQMIEHDPNGAFTPYDGLTNDLVIGWVKSVMTFTTPADVEENLALSIERLINPPVVTLPLPWSF